MNTQRMVELTRQLIALDSVNPCEQAKTEFMEQVLRRRGFATRRFEVEPGRFNLLASFDPAPICVLFNTHIDTVAPQYGPWESQDRIYGRGACDTHGILAAMLEAIEVLRSESLSGLGLLLTVDEEGGEHKGARQAGLDIPPPRVLIVGEPTENCLMRSQKGLLKAELVAAGREGHSGYPERADDALERLLRAIRALRQQPWLTAHSESGSTMNVFIREGGEAWNKIPGRARAGLFLRLVEPMNVVKPRVEDALQALGDPQVTLLWLAGNDPVTHLATLPGWSCGTAAYNTDIAHFGWRDTRTFLFGPGSIHQAHRDLIDGRWDGGEWIDKREQVRGAELYIRLVREVWAENRM